ncbi:MAG: hypothetical protein ACR2NB_06120 [Solirubrobacteraceae bacterium]
MKASSPACSEANPSLPKALCRSGAIDGQIEPSVKPSKLVLPIITHSNATRPGSSGVPGAAGERASHAHLPIGPVHRREASEHRE